MAHSPNNYPALLAELKRLQAENRRLHDENEALRAENQRLSENNDRPAGDISTEENDDAN